MNEQPYKILPKFYDTVHKAEADVYLLWGGRDRGASYFTAQQAILDCLEDDYYRAILVRKTFESIRDSSYQTIKDIASSSNIGEHFNFLKAPLSIQCKLNDNFFIARGCDDSNKIKSTAGVNVAIIEEADQLSEEDFITVYTTLRSNEGRVRIWMAFNSDFPGEYQEHWIWRYYLQHLNDTYKNGLYETEIDVPVGNQIIKQRVRYYSHHSTYVDNPYCPPSRRAVYEGLKEQNPYYYNVYAKGLLGKRENKFPWAWALNTDKHIRPDKYTPSINYNLDLSFDFNHDPCTVVIGQYEQHLPRYNVFAYFRASSGDQSALKQLCDRIAREFPHHFATKQFTVTGDASGTNRDPSRPSTLNRYTDICSHLGISTGVVKIEKANVSHKSSRDLCNDVLHLIPKGGYVFWGGMGIEMLITEIQSAYPDEAESLNKAKAKLGLHGLDAWRYLNQMYFAYQLVGRDFPLYQKAINAVAMRLKTG